MRKWFNKRRVGWLIIAAVALTLGIVLSLLVLGGPERDFTATPYADVIRFEAEGVATLQVRIFDLSGKELWDSGVVSSWVVDWDRRNEFGERLAYGVYLYSAQGWSASGDSTFQKNGKLALMPGDKVQLQSAPLVTTPQSDDSLAPFRDEPFTFQPMAVNVDHSGESWAFGQVGIGTTNPAQELHIRGDRGALTLQKNSGNGAIYFDVLDSTGVEKGYFGYGASNWDFYVANLADANMRFYNDGATRLFIQKNTGNVGIGTISPTAKLEIESSTGQDLIAAYNSSNRVFVVKSTGEVRADGAYYGASFNTGGADVAERINTSEWVEPGNIVEIDPEHPGFFRKTSSPCSTLVAGIISTSPGVILGNSFDAIADKWEDNRPLLAIAGRVPVKATAENGSIQIGDLLVSSSIPGYATRCDDPPRAVGAVIGKAMEPLEEGTGVIMVQVMLR